MALTRKDAERIGALEAELAALKAATMTQCPQCGFAKAYTSVEAAEVLGVSKQHVLNMGKRGQLLAIRAPGVGGHEFRMVFLKDEVDSMAAARNGK